MKISVYYLKYKDYKCNNYTLRCGYNLPKFRDAANRPTIHSAPRSIKNGVNDVVASRRK